MLKIHPDSGETTLEIIGDLRASDDARLCGTVSIEIHQTGLNEGVAIVIEFFSPDVGHILQEVGINLLDYVLCHFDLDGLIGPNVYECAVVLEQFIEQLHLFVREVRHLVQKNLEIDNDKVHSLFQLLKENDEICLAKEGKFFELEANFAQLVLHHVR